jgi:hypothetical protein
MITLSHHVLLTGQRVGADTHHVGSPPRSISAQLLASQPTLATQLTALALSCSGRMASPPGPYCWPALLATTVAYLRHTLLSAGDLLLQLLNVLHQLLPAALWGQEHARWSDGAMQGPPHGRCKQQQPAAGKVVVRASSTKLQLIALSGVACESARLGWHRLEQAVGRCQSGCHAALCERLRPTLCPCQIQHKEYEHAC